MQSRRMDALIGGESEHLTQHYWNAKGTTFNKRSSDEDVYSVYKDVIPLMSDGEIRYLYWELVHTSPKNNIRGHITIMKEYLLTERMDRKYKLGRYKENG